MVRRPAVGVAAVSGTNELSERNVAFESRKMKVSRSRTRLDGKEARGVGQQCKARTAGAGERKHKLDGRWG